MSLLHQGTSMMMLMMITLINLNDDYYHSV